MTKQKPMDKYGLYDLGKNPCMIFDHDHKGIMEMVRVKDNCYGACDRVGLPLPRDVMDIGILISYIERHKRRTDIKKLLITHSNSLCRNLRGLYVSGSIDGPLCIDFPETESFKLAVAMLVAYGNSPDEPTVGVVG